MFDLRHLRLFNPLLYGTKVLVTQHPEPVYPAMPRNFALELRSKPANATHVSLREGRLHLFDQDRRQLAVYGSDQLVFSSY